ncbi:hypothetical protein ANCDUO_05752 [Ancylostoma duodenale]|uniref:Glutaredoxin domain-containing protein n=1 Tax=Ancylostoma duodenale TaxID=51022 RepID=A0A0C2DMU4_9BILA|nr:hypothetical protein ANCDUO_05752 [Ancylostoma duodenale]
MSGFLSINHMKNGEHESRMRYRKHLHHLLPEGLARSTNMSAKTFVDGLLKSHKVVVFSKSYCPYCHKQ